MGVSVLTYHSVGPVLTRPFAPLTVAPALFRQHLAAVCEQDLDVIAFDQVPGALAAGTDAVCITIDDGLADAYDHAAPALRTLDLTATLFVPGGFIGGRSGWLRGEDADRPMLSRRAIAELADEGFEIGVHGHRHIAADVNPFEIVRADAIAGRRALEDCIGEPVASFAYPFGYHSPRARDAVRAAGFAQACAVGDLPARRRDDRWTLPRLQVWGTTTPESLVELIARRPAAPARAWANGKQRVWRAGRHWAGWGPAEAGRLQGASS